MNALEGKVAIVTGAGRGLGLAYAQRLAAEGAAVVVNDLGVSIFGSRQDESRAEQAARTITEAGGRAVAHDGDCASAAGARSMVELALGTFGRLDAVVANAFVTRNAGIIELDEADWDEVMRVQLKGTFLPVHHACRYWAERHAAGERADRSVITVSSVAGIFGWSTVTYATAKLGLVGFALQLSRELAPLGIRVNAIAPGAMTQPGNAYHPDPAVQARLGPERVAPLVAFLVSEHARGLTGGVFHAMGGRVDWFEGLALHDGAFLDGEWTVEGLAAAFADGRLRHAPTWTRDDYFEHALVPVIDAAKASG